ncbi:MAG TPA: permease-like cell division protein FtsX [Burkholderiales bacterium]|nr:permease-like cell division protein FtsX [Burkholderiales bacterium]
MLNWISQHWHTFWQTLGRLARAPISTLLAILVMGTTLCLPAGLYLMLHSLNRLQGVIHENPQVTIFMKILSNSSDIQQVNGLLNQDPKVKDYKFIPKNEALKSLAQRSGITDLLAGLPSNPLPDAFVVRLKNSTPENIAYFKNSVMNWPSVDSVQYDAIWAQRLAALISLGRNFIILISVLLAFTVSVIIGNTIRLQIASRQAEIEVSILIGATRRFIRRPFLYFGALQGLASGLIAWGILELCLMAINVKISAFSNLYGSIFILHSFSPSAIAVLLASSSVAGWLGAIFGTSYAIKNI